MTSKFVQSTQTKTRSGSTFGGAGRLAASLLLILALTSPASAHHDTMELPQLHSGNEAPRARDRRPERPHGHLLARDFHEQAHQHTYTHTHWHTHVLEDGTIIHHKHPHSHTYWHYGPDETEEERVTRVEPDREKAPPYEESERPSGNTRFVRPGHGDGPY